MAPTTSTTGLYSTTGLAYPMPDYYSSGTWPSANPTSSLSGIPTTTTTGQTKGSSDSDLLSISSSSATSLSSFNYVSATSSAASPSLSNLSNLQNLNSQKLSDESESEESEEEDYIHPATLSPSDIAALSSDSSSKSSLGPRALSYDANQQSPTLKKPKKSVPMSPAALKSPLQVEQERAVLQLITTCPSSIHFLTKDLETPLLLTCLISDSSSSASSYYSAPTNQHPFNPHVNQYIIDLLIECGANVNQGDCTGWTPLHAALSRPCIPLVEKLISSGARAYFFLKSILH